MVNGGKCQSSCLSSRLAMCIHIHVLSTLAGETVSTMVKLSIIVVVLLVVVVGYSGAGPAASHSDGLDAVSR